MRQNRKYKSFLRIVGLLTVVCFLTAGCGKNPFALEKTYEEYYQESQKEEDSGLEGMAANLAVLPAEEQNTSGYSSNDYADLLINDTTNEVVESYRCFDRVLITAPSSATTVSCSRVMVSSRFPCSRVSKAVIIFVILSGYTFSKQR